MQEIMIFSHGRSLAAFPESTLEGVSNVVWPGTANQLSYCSTPTFQPITVQAICH